MVLSVEKYRVRPMNLQLPELTPRLRGLTACANAVSLEGNPSLDAEFPEIRSVATASSEPSHGVLRLIRERWQGKTGHLHVDFFHADDFPPDAEQSGAVEDVLEILERFRGATLTVNFESRFLIPSRELLAGTNPVTIFKAVPVCVSGIRAQVEAANLRLADTSFREIRWRIAQPVAAGQEPMFAVEICGSLGRIPITGELMLFVQSRAMEGMDRFFAKKQ